jgi:acylphosphatase
MPDLITKRCHVSGRVQGVYYRVSARDKAIALGVNGYARNLPDGRVEVLAVGSQSAVDALVQWLWVGSPASRVDHVEVQDQTSDSLAELPQGFATR